MQVKDIMTSNPSFCTRDTSLKDVARMMADHDCGAIPVIQSKDKQKQEGKEVSFIAPWGEIITVDDSPDQEVSHDLTPVGIVTDRDIVCRALADGKDPLQMAAGDCMSVGLVTVRPDADVDECARLMQEHRIRRVVVADNDRLCGVVAQADLARSASPGKAAQTVKQVSQLAGAAV